MRCSSRSMDARLMLPSCAKTQRGIGVSTLGLRRVVALVSILLLWGAGCGDSPKALRHQDFLVVVEQSLYEPLRASLERYTKTMARENIEVHVEPWAPGTVDELKELLFQQVDLHGVTGALLVGELPAAWFEQVAFEDHEEFPMDLYLQDRDAVWLDEDENGIFDYHSELTLDIYTARLTGTEAQLEDYFERADRYRRVGPLVDVSAFIFIDDSWSDQNPNRLYHLDELYSSVELLEDNAATTSEAYVTRLTGRGAEFVYQWMHSTPCFIQFKESVGYSYIYRHQIPQYNFKGSFFDLFNCSAARFTEYCWDARASIAETLIVGTDYGLAAVGSTKTGAVSNPHWFHEGLVLGLRWGEAYQLWYNNSGKKNDEWNLGVVLLGDPLLQPTGDLIAPGYTDGSAGSSPPENFPTIMVEIAEEAQLGTFEEYRQLHPEFFM